jgi:hypothetical protein
LMLIVGFRVESTLRWDRLILIAVSGGWPGQCRYSCGQAPDGGVELGLRCCRGEGEA